MTGYGSYGVENISVTGGAQMGIYLNPDSSKFEEAVNSDIYIDKTGLLAYTNSVLHTMQKYICVSRPRRLENQLLRTCSPHITAVAAIQKNCFRRLRLQRTVSSKDI